MKSSSKGCYKKGGGIKDSKAEKADKKEDKEDNKFSTGGAARKAHGVSPKARLDKKSRGKKATPGSPLSGAMPSGLPGGGKAQTSGGKENN